MFDFVPVDHDPFADPPVKADSGRSRSAFFQVGPVAQPADPAMAAAAAAAPRESQCQSITIHLAARANRSAATANHRPIPASPNAPLEQSRRGVDGIDDWFVPAADGYPDRHWFIPKPLATPGQSGPGAQSNATRSACLQPALRFGRILLRPTGRSSRRAVPALFAWHPPTLPELCRAISIAGTGL